MSERIDDSSPAPCSVSDCSECSWSCVLYPGIEHRDGQPFCKDGRPVTVHRLVGFSLERGDMTPNAEREVRT